MRLAFWCFSGDQVDGVLCGSLIEEATSKLQLQCSEAGEIRSRARSLASL